MLNLESLFSLNASEAASSNDWTNTFLHSWSKSGKLTFDREAIIIKRETRSFYQLLKTDEEYLSFEFEKEPTDFNIYAVYQHGPIRQIEYYQHFYEASEEIKSIVRIHERMHAFHHMNPYYTWSDFTNICSVVLEFFAQLFTYKAVAGTYLERYFVQLSKRQPDIYQTWEWYKDFTKQQAFDIYIEYLNIGYSDQIPLITSLQKIYLDCKARNTSSLTSIIDTADFLKTEIAILRFNKAVKNGREFDCIEQNNIDEEIISTMDEIC